MIGKKLLIYGFKTKDKQTKKNNKKLINKNKFKLKQITKIRKILKKIISKILSRDKSLDFHKSKIEVLAIRSKII